MTEVQLPSWIDRKFLEIILHKFDSSAKLIEFKATLGCKPSEHFMSVMFKVSLIYNTTNTSDDVNQTLNTIIKTVPESDGQRKEYVEKTPCFKNELRVYERVISSVQKLLIKTGDDTKIAPKVFYQSDKPVPVIVMEDLTPQGYSTFDHPPGFEIAKNIAVITGKFHATTLFLHESGVDLSDFIDTDFDTENSEFDFGSVYLLPTYKFLIEECRKWSEFAPFIDRMEKITPNFMEYLTDHFMNRDKSKYKVLTHGDFHYTNIMFKGNGVSIKDFIMIDFQFVLWNSPAYEVYSLINLMSNAHAREHHRNDIINIYFSEFQATLKRLGYLSPPSYDDLLCELKRSTFLDLMQNTALVPFQYIDVDSEEFEKAEGVLTERIKLGIRNPEYRTYLYKHIERLLSAVEELV